VILLFVLETVLCAAAVAVLFGIAWREGYAPATAVLGVALVPLLVLAILSVRAAL
jgi:hypothetical protein